MAELGTAWPSLAALVDLNTWDDVLEEFDDIVGLMNRMGSKRRPRLVGEKNIIVVVAAAAAGR